MPTIGDYFNDDLKKKFTEQHIAVGSVIKCFVKKTAPPKEKRFVVLGIDDSGNVIGVVFINSEINWKIHNTLELAQLQLFVRKEEND